MERSALSLSAMCQSALRLASAQKRRRQAYRVPSAVCRCEVALPLKSGRSDQQTDGRRGEGVGVGGMIHTRLGRGTESAKGNSAAYTDGMETGGADVAMEGHAFRLYNLDHVVLCEEDLSGDDRCGYVAEKVCSIGQSRDGGRARLTPVQRRSEPKGTCWLGISRWTQCQLRPAGTARMAHIRHESPEYRPTSYSACCHAHATDCLGIKHPHQHVRASTTGAGWWDGIAACMLPSTVLRASLCSSPKKRASATKHRTTGDKASEKPSPPSLTTCLERASDRGMNPV